MDDLPDVGGNSTTNGTLENSCIDKHLMELLRTLYASNATAWNVFQTNKNCSFINTSLLGSDIPHLYNLKMHDIGKDIFAYCTPIIIFFGLLGNGISLKVFTSKVMRRMSASLYLAAISISDILVLLTYVLIDWLNHGLVRWPGKKRLSITSVNGACQTFLFVSYMFRLLSAWLLVVFAIERYMAVCQPVYRKRVCTRRFAWKLITGVFLCSALACLYKPIISQVYEKTFEKVCTRNPDFHQLNFIFDALYGMMITAVPAIVILLLNLPILKRLIHWKKQGKSSKLVVKENKIRLEFTIILISISACFVCLNLPYFVTWCQQFQQSLNPQGPTVADRISGQLYLTRTVFFINYSINFVMYCTTGAYYRREIKSMFRYYVKNPEGQTNTTYTTPLEQFYGAQRSRKSNRLILLQ